jgi:hypothetical protein
MRGDCCAASREKAFMYTRMLHTYDTHRERKKDTDTHAHTHTHTHTHAHTHAHTGLLRESVWISLSDPGLGFRV